MVQVPTGQVIETDRTRKTTGGVNIPGQLTKQPKDGYVYGTTSQWNHDGNDVTGFVGVDEYYRTYADGRNKPGGTITAPVALGFEDTDEARYAGVAGDGFVLGVEHEESTDDESEEAREKADGEDKGDDSDPVTPDDPEGDDSDDDDKKPASEHKKPVAKKAPAPKLPA